MEQKFYVCEHCGNIIAYAQNNGVPVTCCGQKMKELIPNTTDAATEKHVPIFAIDGNKVYVVVGEVEHPMTEQHYIQWISLQTKQGNQRKCLTPADKPVACFSICEGDQVEAVYEYCNLHGLWKAENVIAPVCDLKPVDVNSKENYLVCKCNNVSYFDILNALESQKDIGSLLSLFDAVKNTTHCSTGCGGCYQKVMSIISSRMSK